ncbi:carboxypeptidase-like regulatory domain-containing protein [Treponema pedis]|uniref:Carboxypeptidase regulatory-like domain-containing protein n=1 Tax=Treponema pedis TaxID=409322 RepID=A0A7S6WQK4_9SPIR|nr:carboxypeptidase-like regulatory domain-containing protein [Treponema pedis]QOW61480.1 carboxypeptidase regulatory-like domain-containing protein [Treponema pedis]QSI03725.1 carboxypeptidase regulatory-like domain-containing protein [Treponema pedis]
MNYIYGIVQNEQKEPVANAKVALLDDNFKVAFSTETDKNGKFNLQAEAKLYPHFIVEKDYGTKYLEYWANNINLKNDIEINPKLGRLELYKLGFFSSMEMEISKSIMIYFRPISLHHFLANEKAIAPQIKRESITISINGEFCEILLAKTVIEHTEGVATPVIAYAFKIAADNIEFNGNNRLEVSVTDVYGEYGEAVLFF